MEFKKLADLLYPHAADYKVFETMYPHRDVAGEVTRFAPSPTGYLHIGHYFPNVISRYTADATGGLFYIRLEDTDKKREVAGASHVLFKALHTFGILADEGRQPDGTEIGNYGPYTQSQRKHIYQAYAKKLVADGKAFPCFCEITQGGKADATERRKKKLAENKHLQGKDTCRALTYENIEANLKTGKPFALRLRSEGMFGEKIKFKDEVRGDIVMQKNDQDVVLMKSDGMPPYAFAHAVDDHLMRTTLVVRGEEWLPSTPAHIAIFEALGFKRVKYLPPPVILKIDEKTGNPRKISKSKDPEFFVTHFLKEGYPTDAVTEYVLTLANSGFEPWRLKNPNLSYKEYSFNYENIGSASPLYDEMKLNHIAKNIIAKMTKEEVYENVLAWASVYDQVFYNTLCQNKDYAVSVFGIERTEKRARKDIAKMSEMKEAFDYMFYEPAVFENDGALNQDEKGLILKEYAKLYDADDVKEVWFSKIKKLAVTFNYCDNIKNFNENPQKYKGNITNFVTMIRVAVTGRETSPDLYEIMKLLGREKVEDRLVKRSEK